LGFHPSQYCYGGRVGLFRISGFGLRILLVRFPAGLDKFLPVMRKVEIQFLDQGFHRVLFDAVPVPIFVVDEDVCILDYNKAATQLLGKTRRFVIGQRCGEVLRCIHSLETPGGCGHAPACRDCVVRNSVWAAARGHRIVRQWAKMEFGHDGKRTRANLRVSCQRFTYGRHAYVLLILEGLND
jgi:PAS domain-containing protein